MMGPNGHLAAWVLDAVYTFGGSKVRSEVAPKWRN